jgi:hypothetical protein
VRVVSPCGTHNDKRLVYGDFLLLPALRCGSNPARTHAYRWLQVGRAEIFALPELRPFAVSPSLAPGIAKKAPSRYHRAPGITWGYFENFSINELSVSASPCTGETFDSASSRVRIFVELYRRLGKQRSSSTQSEYPTDRGRCGGQQNEERSGR